ncbi:flagellar protein FlaG [Marinimicrobium sp. ARAG 43.8]|uniref:flagellar protein FlaG n=1 Tax=Marinimicrobium sp. ARAG 43.8 TaxID=3418719 RepID=UPI003CE73E5B
MSEVAIVNSGVRVEFPDLMGARRASPDSTQQTEKEGGKALPPSFSSVPAKLAPVEAVHQDASEAVREAITQMNEYIQSTQRDLRFTIDRELGETIVKVVDRQTEEVVRQIPDETFLKLARSIREQEPIHFFNDHV